MAPKRFSLSPSQRQVIRARYGQCGARALAEELGVPKYLVKNLAHKEGLRRDPEHSQRRPLSDSERAFLKLHYTDKSTKWVATQLGRTMYAVYRTAQLMGLKKSSDYLNTPQGGRMQKGCTLGAATRFKKGNVPHSKGKPVSPETYAVLARTMFKKGNVPHTTKSDGHISIRRDADGRQYFWVRIGLANWKHLHRKLWEDAHGPVPEGHVITFKDGNRGNCVLENLEMVTEAKRLLRTTIHNYPPDIKDAIRALARLKRTIRTHEQARYDRGADAPAGHDA